MAGVVHSQSRVAREIFCEGQVLGAIDDSGLARDEGDRAKAAAVREERDAHVGAKAEVAKDGEVLIVDGALREHLVGDLRDELGLSGTHDGGRAGGCVRIRRVALLGLAGDLHLGGIDVSERETMERVVLTRHVDDAPVGQLRDDELSHLLERPLVVQ